MILSLTVILVAWAVARAGGFRDQCERPSLLTRPARQACEVSHRLDVAQFSCQRCVQRLPEVWLFRHCFRPLLS